MTRLPTTVPPLPHDALITASEVEYILSDTCRHDTDVSISDDPPERPGILRLAPIERHWRVPGTYSSSSKDGLTDEVANPVPPSTMHKVTYCYIDTSPVAILLNRYGIQSCHTLDNTEHEYRTGNVNWLYNPWMASLFSKKTNPATVEPGSIKLALSPVTRHPCYLSNGTELQYRTHTAAANVFVMRNEAGEPYIVLSRPYDSASIAEPGSFAAMLQYCFGWAEKNGFGFAVYAGSLLERIGYSASVDAYMRDLLGVEMRESIHLETPGYTYPFHSHGDMGQFASYYDWGLGASVHCTTAFAAPLLLPDSARYTELAKEVVDAPCAPIHPPYSFVNTFHCRSSDRCESCGGNYHDEETYSTDGGTVYCETCYWERYARCYECDYEMLRDDAQEGTDGEPYCDHCFQKHFIVCEDCSTVVWRPNAETRDGDNICSICAAERDDHEEKEKQEAEKFRCISCDKSVQNLFAHSTDAAGESAICWACIDVARREVINAQYYENGRQTFIRERDGSFFTTSARPSVYVARGYDINGRALFDEEEERIPA